MRVTLIQNGRELRQIDHKNESFIEAPESGDYVVRLYNHYPSRRMVVLSVDGINVINGEDAGFAGPGYVLDPYQTVDVPGWRRDEKKVAKFCFGAETNSYAAKTKRGTANVGVIGIAVFEEKVKPLSVTSTSIWPNWFPYNPHFVPYYQPMYNQPTYKDLEVICNSDLGASIFSTQSLNVGTGYGKETTFHTADTDFERAFTSPSLIIQLRYATRERLIEWGVPVTESVSEKRAPNPFPASRVGCVAPEGWSHR